MPVDWQGRRATAALHLRLQRGMTRAGEELRDGTKAAIEVQGPPRSTPGNPPHMDSGLLHETYWSQTIATTGTIRTVVGSSLPYAPYLELGTPDMAPRPHARMVLYAMQGYLPSVIFS